MAKTRQEYETYHDAQCDLLFNPPPLDESGPSWAPVEIDGMKYHQQGDYLDAANPTFGWRWWLIMAALSLASLFVWSN